jgi:hypothetical protein
LDFRQGILREDDLRMGPAGAIVGGQEQGTPGRNMLADRVAEVLEVEALAPPSEVGLVVVGPTESPAFRRLAAVSPERLELVNANGVPEPTVIEALIGLFVTDIAYGFGGADLHGRWLAGSGTRCGSNKHQAKDEGCERVWAG